MEYYASINLKAFKNSFVADIKGKTTTKKCVCIPIEDNGFYCGEKTITASMVAYETDKFGHSHSLRQSVSAEMFNAMTEDERKAIPYVGHLKPKVADVLANATSVETENVQPADGEDLPF